MKSSLIYSLLWVFTLSTSALAIEPNWDFNPYAYQYDMTIFMSLEIDNEEVTSPTRYSLAAFHQEECRGVSEVRVSEGNSYYYLRIRSNSSESESISFRVHDTETGKVAKSYHTVNFASQALVGLPSAPLRISALNPYSVTFIADGVSSPITVYYGESFTLPDIPLKVGHTFTQWLPEVATTVVTTDVNYTAQFTLNSYVVKFQIEGVILAETLQPFGTPLVAPTVEAREGYTFSWSPTLHETMPAEDVTYVGSYALNTYYLTYLVDGEEYLQVDVPYNEAIQLIAPLEREGYTFSGWSEVQPYMPAHDLTTEATFDVNYYKLTYILDDLIYAEYDVAYQTSISPLTVDVEEGMDFSGWDNLPEIMPSHDLTIYGSTFFTAIVAVDQESQFADLYSLDGLLIQRKIDVTKLAEILPPGIYLIKGKKIRVR